MHTFTGEETTDFALFRCEEFRLFEMKNEGFAPRPPHESALTLQTAKGEIIHIDKQTCHTLAWALLQWCNANPKGDREE